MKKSYVLFILLIVSSFSFAQIQWQENGIPVRQGENIIWTQTSVACSDGTSVFAWSDTRDGTRGIYAQKVDDNGNSLWGENGLLVNHESSYRESPVLVESGNGDVIIAWIDFRNEWSGDVFAQKISSFGDVLWADEGVPLCLSEEYQQSLNIVSDDNGGAFVIWLDGRNVGGSDIYGTHIDTNGNIVSGWGYDGNPIISNSGSQNQHTLWKDGENGAVVAWFDYRDPNDPNIYMQRIASNGYLLWNNDGIQLTDAVGPQEKPKITPDGTGNFIFTWRDRGTDVFGDIMAQRVDLNGNLLWANEVEVYVGEGIQRNARITKASDNGAIIVWEDGRNEISENYKDLYAQKLDLNGNLQWSVLGIEIVQALNDQLNPRLSGDDNGGAWIIWEDGRINNHPHEDIYIQHVNSSGTFELPANGYDLCSAEFWQFSPNVKLSENKIFCVWGDRRLGSTSLYVQLLDYSGNPILEEDGEEIITGLSGSINDLKLLTNEDNPIFLWTDMRNMYDSQIYFQILNDDGTSFFPENGIPITSNTQSDQQYLEAVFSESSGTIAAVWSDNRLDYSQVYAQGINTAGSYLWSDSTGLRVGESEFHQENPMISVMENSGIEEYYIGWEDYTDFMDSRIQGQKIIDGNLEWGTEGKVIVDIEGSEELTDIVKDYFIYQSIGYNNRNIYCFKVDENGDPAPGWSENGLEICIEDGRQWQAQGIMIPQGLLIIWEDYRNGDVDIYGQIVTSDGNILWQENGLPLVTQENDQDGFRFIYDDELYIVWQDFRSSYFYEIYIQKFDLDGNELWQEGGVLAAEAYDNHFVNPDLVKVGDKITIVWENYNDYDGENIYSQLVSDEGELLWQQQGIIICNEIMDQSEPLIVSNGDNDVYISWNDGRSTTMSYYDGLMSIPGVYAQKLHIEPTSADDKLVEPIEILSNYPNPFNPVTTISFSVTQTPSFVNIDIFNIKGQRVRNIPINLSGVEGERHAYSVTWNGEDENEQPVASGIYLYQLNVDKKVIASRKCLLLK